MFALIRTVASAVVFAVAARVLIGVARLLDPTT